MANYGLVINSKFKPFSYEEMLAPVQAATTAHRELEDAYSDLTTKAKTLESMLNRDLDTNEYNQYKGYLDKIDKISEDLAKNGLNPSSRQSLRDLNSAYMSEIAPMQTAAQLRSEKAKLQLEMEIKNPNLRYDRRADQIGLREYMNNPDLGFKTVDLNDVTNRVFQEANTLSKEILEGDEETLREVLGGDYYEQYKQRGLTREQVLATIMNKEGGSKALSDIINRNIKRTGVEDWGNQDVYNQVIDAAKLGAWGAVGTAETQLVNNWKLQKNLDQQQWMERLYMQHPELRSENDPKYIPINDPRNPNYRGGGEIDKHHPIIKTWSDVVGNSYVVQAINTRQGKDSSQYATKLNGEDLDEKSIARTYFEHHGFLNWSDASSTPNTKKSPYKGNALNIPVEAFNPLYNTTEEAKPFRKKFNEMVKERGLSYTEDDLISGKVVIARVEDKDSSKENPYYTYLIISNPSI